jgi:ferritin-like metal-binding protein YciE
MADLTTNNLFTLRDLLHEQMRDLFDAESQYARLLPEMDATATAPELKARFQAILAQTGDNLTHLAHVCTRDVRGNEGSGTRGQGAHL